MTKGSVAKMLARELAPQSMPDPTFQLLTSVLQPCTYFVSLSGDVLLSVPKFVEPRGGILYATLLVYSDIVDASDPFIS